MEIEGHRLEPTVFARYYELVLSLKSGRNGEAKALFREIADQVSRSPDFRLLSFGDPALAAESSRYLRWLTPRSSSVPLVEAPEPRVWAQFERNVRAAMDLIERADAALGAELRSLVVEVIGASSHRESPQSFDGASSFMLWGSVFLNVDAHCTRVDVAEGLVHEGAHQLLFGLSCRAPLVRNALHERYASPLRSDPRPVIGIYHATFVCARLAYAFAAMLRPGVGITDDERASLEARLRRVKNAFADGNSTLRKEADLTDLGGQLLGEAEAAVAEI